jgi:hypothetical protein
MMNPLIRKKRSTPIDPPDPNSTPPMPLPRPQIVAGVPQNDEQRCNPTQGLHERQ